MNEKIYVGWNINFYKNYHKSIDIEVGYMQRSWSDVYKAYGPINGIITINFKDSDIKEKDGEVLSSMYIPLDKNLLIMRIPREYFDIFDGLKEIRIDTWYRP